MFPIPGEMVASKSRDAHLDDSPVFLFCFVLFFLSIRK